MSTDEKLNEIIKRLDSIDKRLRKVEAVAHKPVDISYYIDLIRRGVLSPTQVRELELLDPRTRAGV